MNDRRTTVQALRRRMAKFVSDRQWQKYHRPKNLAMSLAIETAELMEHFQWLTHAQADRMLRDPAARAEVANEMADIFAFLLSLANSLDVDLSAAFESKMARNELKYPAAKFRGWYQRPKRQSPAVTNTKLETRNPKQARKRKKKNA